MFLCFVTKLKLERQWQRPPKKTSSVLVSTSSLEDWAGRCGSTKIPQSMYVSEWVGPFPHIYWGDLTLLPKAVVLRVHTPWIFLQQCTPLRAIALDFLQTQTDVTISANCWSCFLAFFCYRKKKLIYTQREWCVIYIQAYIQDCILYSVLPSCTVDNHLKCLTFCVDCIGILITL